MVTLCRGGAHLTWDYLLGHNRVGTGRSPGKNENVSLVMGNGHMTAEEGRTRYLFALSCVVAIWA